MALTILAGSAFINSSTFIPRPVWRTIDASVDVRHVEECTCVRQLIRVLLARFAQRHKYPFVIPIIGQILQVEDFRQFIRQDIDFFLISGLFP